jgi:Kef-type K+ transport system membrane component KefB
MVCAAIDDVTAWCLLAFVVAVTGNGTMAGVVVKLGLVILYGAVMWICVRPLVARWRPPLPLLVVMAVTSAWTTDEIGIHAVFGAFAAGVICPRRMVATWRLERPLRLLATAVLLPIYFTTVGVATRIGSLDSLALWMMCGLVLATAVVAKFGGAAIAARLAGEPWDTAVLIGVLMNTRGLTEIVILTVGLEIGVLTTTAFSMMVIMALATTVMAPPSIRFLLRRQPSLAAHR